MDSAYCQAPRKGPQLRCFIIEKSAIGILDLGPMGEGGFGIHRTAKVSVGRVRLTFATASSPVTCAYSLAARSVRSRVRTAEGIQLLILDLPIFTADIGLVVQ